MSTDTTEAQPTSTQALLRLAHDYAEQAHRQIREASQKRGLYGKMQASNLARYRIISGIDLLMQEARNLPEGA